MEKLSNRLMDAPSPSTSLSSTILCYENTLKTILNDEILLREIEVAYSVIASALLSGNKLLFAGNGGSAAEASHITAEYVVRFKHNRQALPAINLSADQSILTAISNDFGFDHVFARQIRAYAQKDDVVILYSTSGASKNILSAISQSKDLELKCILFTGLSCKLPSTPSQIVIPVPSRKVAEIQQLHNMIGHWICDNVEHLFIYGLP